MKKPNRTLSPREIALGYVALVAVLFGLVHFFFIPQNRQLALDSKKTAELDLELKHDYQIIQASRGRSIASVEGKLKSSPMGDYIYSSRKLAQIVEQFTDGDKKLVTRMIKFENAKQSKNHKDISFTVELVGSFLSIGSFVERLESSHLLAEVASVDIVRQGADLDKCVAKVAVNTRLFPEDENE
jgi:hypothetical protein